MPQRSHRKKKDHWQREIRPYKLTGNIALDMVGECLNHAERHRRIVKFIELDHKYWRIFVEGVKSQDESYDLSDNEVNFDNVPVRKGSMFQGTPLYHELVSNSPTMRSSKN